MSARKNPVCVVRNGFQLHDLKDKELKIDIKKFEILSYFTRFWFELN
tara:strand:- start:259 stop:399 length:141 start_codon:yes stop_codon:yes gene_type:complete